MYQVLQNVKTGETTLDTVPPPALKSGGVRVRTAASLISAGTEKMLIDLAQKSYLGKAKARPDLVKQVLNKVQKEGLWNTFQKVTCKKNGLGAAPRKSSGLSDKVSGLQVGDRVALG